MAFSSKLTYPVLKTSRNCKIIHFARVRTSKTKDYSFNLPTDPKHKFDFFSYMNMAVESFPATTISTFTMYFSLNKKVAHEASWSFLFLPRYGIYCVSKTEHTMTKCYLFVLYNKIVKILPSIVLY